MESRCKIKMKKTFTCPNCKYKWIARVEFPKECPDCKFRFKYKQKSK